jgi:hypothetical protein
MNEETSIPISGRVVRVEMVPTDADLRPAPLCVICGQPAESDTHSTCGSKNCDQLIGPYGTIQRSSPEDNSINL